MKKRILAFAILISLLAVGASPVYAFDLPSQGTDNATDVIYWPGTSIPIIIQGSISTDVNVSSNITITSLQDAMTAAAEAQASVIVDNQTVLASEFLALLILALLIALVFWQRTLFLYCLAVPVCMVYGLNLAADNTNGSTQWVSGIAVAIIGAYCLAKAVMMGWEKYKARQ